MRARWVGALLQNWWVREYAPFLPPMRSMLRHCSRVFELFSSRPWRDVDVADRSPQGGASCIQKFDLLVAVERLSFPVPTRTSSGWRLFRPRSVFTTPITNTSLPRRILWYQYMLFTQLEALLGADLRVLKFRGHHGHLRDLRQWPPHGGLVCGA